MTDSPLPEDVQSTHPTRFSGERAREAGRRSAEVRRQKREQAAAEAAAAAEEATVEEAVQGLQNGSGDALGVLREIARRGTSETARVTAARALLDVELQVAAVEPTTVAEIRALPTLDLVALIGRLERELARSLPTEPEPA